MKKKKDNFEKTHEKKPQKPTLKALRVNTEQSIPSRPGTEPNHPPNRTIELSAGIRHPISIRKRNPSLPTPTNNTKRRLIHGIIPHRDPRRTPQTVEITGQIELIPGPRNHLIPLSGPSEAIRDAGGVRVGVIQTRPQIPLLLDDHILAGAADPLGYRLDQVVGLDRVALLGDALVVLRVDLGVAVGLSSALEMNEAGDALSGLVVVNVVVECGCLRWLRWVCFQDVEVVLIDPWD